MKRLIHGAHVLAALALAAACLGPARAAETLRVGWGVGTTYLPLQIMADRKLVEKRAAAMGIADLAMQWSSFGSATAMNDALLSGSIDLGSGGVSTFMPLWDKTRKSNPVMGVGALSAMPMYLVTRNPAVRTVRDFTARDKIAVAGIKVSYQAMILQMAAAQAFGEREYARLDPLTVTRSNSDGVIALLGGGEITAHISPPPFSTRELADPATHLVLNSYDVLGGPATLTMVWGGARFREQRPKVYAAFVAALKEAQEIINADLQEAAATYLRVSGDKASTVQAIHDVIAEKNVEWTAVPNGTFKVAEFMARIGTISRAPASWKDLFFPELHDAPGS